MRPHPQPSPRLSPRLSPRALVSTGPTAARVPVSGALVPGKYSSLRGFSNFEYIEEPFEILEKSRLAHIHPASQPSRPTSAAGSNALASPRPVFKTSALPPAPRNAGAFQQFRYALDPFEALETQRRVESHSQREKVIASAFLAGGNARGGGKRSLRLRMPELRTQLHRTLLIDWQQCYRGLVVDQRGMLLAAFETGGLGVERRADLHTYMNRILAKHPSAVEFGITRDASRWGTLFAGSHDRLVYAFRPPWVPNDAFLMHRGRDASTSSNCEVGCGDESPRSARAGGAQRRGV